MKWSLALALMLLTLLAGCATTPTPAPEPSPGPPIQVGDTPRHINPAQCSAEARNVIDHGRLMQINGCETELVRLADGTPAHYVLITYGPGMDCPAGCIYAQQAAVVLPGRVALLPEPFMRNEEIRYHLNTKLQISLPDDFLKETDRHFVERDGNWQMVLTFHKYLDGYVLLNPTNNWEKALEIHATPSGIQTLEQVRAQIWSAYQLQCKPPTGAQNQTHEVAPREDGGWNATLVWDLGDQYDKVFTQVDPNGQVTFPEGCGKY